MQPGIGGWVEEVARIAGRTRVALLRKGGCTGREQG